MVRVEAAWTKPGPIGCVELNLLQRALRPWLVVLAHSIEASDISVGSHDVLIFSSAAFAPRPTTMNIIFAIMYGGSDQVDNLVGCYDCC